VTFLLYLFSILRFDGDATSNMEEGKRKKKKSDKSIIRYQNCNKM